MRVYDNVHRYSEPSRTSKTELFVKAVSKSRYLKVPCCMFD